MRGERVDSSDSGRRDPCHTERHGSWGATVTASPHFSLLETRWIAEHPTLRYRRLSGSLLSADLSGFTALSERLAESRQGGRRAAHGDGQRLLRRTDPRRRARGRGRPEVRRRRPARVVRGRGASGASGHGPAPGCSARSAPPGSAVRDSACPWARTPTTSTCSSSGRPAGGSSCSPGAPVTTTVDLEAAAGRGEVLVSTELGRTVCRTRLLDEPQRTSGFRSRWAR